MKRHVGVAYLLCVLAACVTETKSSDSSTAAADTSSTPPALTYSLDSLWSVVSLSGDSPLAEPVALAPDSLGIVVSDRVRGIVALSSNGTSRKVTFRESLIPGAEFIVMPRNRGGSRAERVDLSGQQVNVVFARNLGANDICITRQFEALIAGGEHALATVELTNDNATPVDLPWPNLRDSSSLLQQVSLASSPDGGCVAALTFGGGFATTDDGSSFRTFATRERVPLPQVRQSTDSMADTVRHEERLLEYRPAVLDAAMTDTIVFLAFAGETPIRQGLIDLYHRHTGTYLGSAMVGSPVRSLAVRGDTVFVLHPFEDGAAVTAFRIRPQS